MVIVWVHLCNWWCMMKMKHLGFVFWMFIQSFPTAFLWTKLKNFFGSKQAWIYYHFFSHLCLERWNVCSPQEPEALLVNELFVISWFIEVLWGHFLLPEWHQVGSIASAQDSLISLLGTWSYKKYHGALTVLDTLWRQTFYFMLASGRRDCK